MKAGRDEASHPVSSWRGRSSNNQQNFAPGMEA
jgi:hypothetical protein